jgi:hypothetical protein
VSGLLEYTIKDFQSIGLLLPKYFSPILDASNIFTDLPILKGSR